MRSLLTLVLAVVLAAPVFSPSAAEAAEWTIDAAHSNVGFKVRHMMVSWTRGSFGKVEGAVTYDPGNPSSLAVAVTIDVASIDTENKKRDEHLRSADFFDVENHPTMTFKSSTAKAGDDGSISLVGTLTIKGVSKEVTLAVESMSEVMTDPWGNTKVGTSATLKLDRKDFGLTWNKTLDGGGVVVGDEVRIAIDVELNQKKAE